MGGPNSTEDYFAKYPRLEELEIPFSSARKMSARKGVHYNNALIMGLFYSNALRTAHFKGVTVEQLILRALL